MAKKKGHNLANARLRKVYDAGGVTPAAPAPAGQSSPHHRPGRAAKTHLTVFFAPTVKQALRLLCVEENTTLQKLMREAVNDLFEKRGKPAIAE